MAAAHGPTRARSDKGKCGKGAKGKSKKETRTRRKMTKPASKFEGECRYCQKKGHKKAECRKMKADLAAGKCDKNGNRCQLAHSDRRDAAFTASELCTESGEHHLNAADGPCIFFPESRWQSGVSAGRNQVHQHDRRLPWLQAWTEQNTRWILDLA